MTLTKKEEAQTTIYSFVCVWMINDQTKEKKSQVYVCSGNKMSEICI